MRRARASHVCPLARARRRPASRARSASSATSLPRPAASACGVVGRHEDGLRRRSGSRAAPAGRSRPARPGRHGLEHLERRRVARADRRLRAVGHDAHVRGRQVERHAPGGRKPSMRTLASPSRAPAQALDVARVPPAIAKRTRGRSARGVDQHVDALPLRAGRRCRPPAARALEAQARARLGSRRAARRSGPDRARRARPAGSRRRDRARQVLGHAAGDRDHAGARPRAASAASAGACPRPGRGGSRGRPPGGRGARDGARIRPRARAPAPRAARARRSAPPLRAKVSSCRRAGRYCSARGTRSMKSTQAAATISGRGPRGTA